MQRLCIVHLLLSSVNLLTVLRSLFHIHLLPILSLFLLTEKQDLTLFVTDTVTRAHVQTAIVSLRHMLSQWHFNFNLRVVAPLGLAFHQITLTHIAVSFLSLLMVLHILICVLLITVLLAQLVLVLVISGRPAIRSSTSS